MSKKITHIFQTKTLITKIFGVVVIFILLGAYAKTFAIGAPYSAGDTLDPACAPGEVNCIVQIISGATDIDGLTDAIYDGSSVFLGTGSGVNDDGTNNWNVGVGYNSLNANITGMRNTSTGYSSLLSNTTGYHNSSYGTESLKANISGNYNSGVGSMSLFSNTTGSENSAYGSSSLFNNKSGSYNSAYGYSSMYANMSGSYNTASGYYSLQNLGTVYSATALISGISYTIQSTGTTDFTVCGAANSNTGTVFTHSGTPCTGTGTASSNSNYNVGLGYQAGRYIANGSTALNAPSSSLFIGGSTKALADGATNEIVIGYNATGNGSNTATIGNTSLLRTYLTGVNLKAGTATAGTAPLKLTAGTNLTTTEGGAIEFDGTHLYFTAVDAGTRYQLDQQSGGATNIDGLTDGISDGSSVFLGSGSGALDDGTANANVGVGINVLPVNTTGNYNASIGYGSLFSNINGFNNIAVGSNSMYSNKAGGRAVAIGSDAMYYINNKVSPLWNNTNIAIGYQTMRGSTNAAVNTALNNTAIGYQSMYSFTTGGDNTSLGYQSLYSNTTGTGNTSIGSYTAYTNSSGINNTALGSQALYMNSSGGENTATGYATLSSNTTGSRNTASGYQSLRFNTTGTNNSALGYEAGNYITGGATQNLTSDYSIYIGTSTKALADNGQNEIVIGYNTTGNGSNTTTIGTGNVLYVGGAGVTGKAARFTNSAGYCDVDPLTTALVCSSDINLKKNIVLIGEEEKNFILNENIEVPDTILDKLNILTPVAYNWLTENENDKKHVGLIAQEVEQLFPDIVFTDSNTGLKSIAYTNFIPYTIKAIQEMNVKIEGFSSLDTSDQKSLGSLIKQFLENSFVFVKEITTGLLRINGDVCVDDVCITKDQFKQMLINATATEGGPSSSVSSEPEVIIEQITEEDPSLTDEESEIPPVEDVAEPTLEEPEIVEETPVEDPVVDNSIPEEDSSVSTPESE